MPTERFYRLPKEKAEIIRKAAIQEFKRVPPEEASINKIIQSAEISRGSFYTYFEDKDDLLRWIMGDFMGDYRQFYLTALEENGGDLWDVFDQALTHSIRWVADQGLIDIIGNLMRSHQFTEQFPGMPKEDCKIEEENRNYAALLREKVNPECCTLELEEFQELLRMHIASLIISLKLFFINQESLEEIQAAYDRRMKLLRYGACPR